MISIKNNKTATVLTTITVFASILIISVLAIGNGHSALAATPGNGTGINVATGTNQTSNCETEGGTSGVSNSCSQNSSNNMTESGGTIHK